MVEIHDVELRAEDVSEVVEGFALKEFAMKPLTTVSRSNAWKETFFQEDNAELTAQGPANIEGVPRLSSFPSVDPSWTEKTATQVKHAAKGTIAWEDIETNEFDTQARLMLKVARSVANSVDSAIYDVLTESQSPSDINSFSISSGDEWDSSTVANRDPIDDMLHGIQLIEESEYSWQNGQGFFVVSPRTKRTLLSNPDVRNAGRFFTDSPTRNGMVGQLLGGTLISTTAATDDDVLVGLAKECGTYKEALPLTTVTEDDELVSRTVKTAEIGITQLTNPSALTLIQNVMA